MGRVDTVGIESVTSDGAYLQEALNVLFAMRMELLFLLFLVTLSLGRRIVGVASTSGKQAALKGDSERSTPRTGQHCCPAWLVPHLRRVQDTRGLDLYRSAIQAGFDLRLVPIDDRDAILPQLVAVAVRSGRGNDAMQIFCDVRACRLKIEEALLTSAVKLCASRSLFHDGLAIYDYVVEDADFTISDRSAWSSLVYCALEANMTDRCIQFFEELRKCGTPSIKDFGSMVRVAQIEGDWRLAVSLVKDIKSAGLEIDAFIYNTVLAVCVMHGQLRQADEILQDMETVAFGLADAITYNTLMKGHAKAGDMDRCCAVYDRMRENGVVASSVTYGILLDGVINANKPELVGNIFDQILSDGCQMNTVLYTTLMKGFARASEVDRAMDVYELMKKANGTPPDVVTYATLIKANCDACRLDVALELLGEMHTAGLRPDEVVFNNLFSGCRVCGSVALCRKLYGIMVSSGIKPTNAIFSNLIRVYADCKCLGEAVDMLSREPELHGVEPAPRIFMQLISCCIRERQGRRAVHAYELMVKYSIPQEDVHHSILYLCVRLNMFDTAAGILSVAAKRGAWIETTDLDFVRDNANKKQKWQCLERIQEYTESRPSRRPGAAKSSLQWHANDDLG
eukprot:TRINITY_DN51013_c0_g1_i1.p1 TRINITY_DN51013_c0_g1~~TRINITY_DN51013_c0_g1_i1.p1  ORF type:complete len:625 (+),score=118.86 TRINITY_DN51013_c0_g1_i1:162-2036(+)